MAIDKEEVNRIGQWISIFNNHDDGWEVGDIKRSTEQTADIVNKSLKIALELKREKGGSLNYENKNVSRFSNRLQNYIDSANNKFNNYSGFRTILLIEMASSSGILESAMSGIKQLHFENGILSGSSIRNKNLFKNAEKIGCIIFWPAQNSLGSNKVYYFDNPFASINVKISKKMAENIFGNHLIFLELNNG